MNPHMFYRLFPWMSCNNCSSWLMGVGFCLLIFGSVITILVSDGDATRWASLNAANVLTLTLFWWLRAFGRAAPRPTSVKVAVWFSSTSIMAILTWSMTLEAPLLAKTILWGLVVVTTLGTCYSMFWSHNTEQPSDRSVGRPPNVCFCFCLIFVFFLSFVVIYKAHGANIIADRVTSLIFQFVSWFASGLLLWCIAVMEIAPHNSAMREWMKIGAWAFATMLATMVVSKLAEVFPLPMRYVAWAMVGASSISCLYAFFFQREAYLVIGGLREIRISSE